MQRRRRLLPRWMAWGPAHRAHEGCRCAARSPLRSIARPRLASRPPLPGREGLDSTRPIRWVPARRSQHIRSPAWSLQSSLPQDVSQCTCRDVTARLARHCHRPGLCGMAVGAMASALALEAPTVRFDEPDRIAHLHVVLSGALAQVRQSGRRRLVFARRSRDVRCERDDHQTDPGFDERLVIDLSRDAEDVAQQAGGEQRPEPEGGYRRGLFA